MKFNYQSFKNDSSKLDKSKLIQIYLYLHSENESTKKLNKRQNDKIKNIVLDILKNKYDCQLGEVTRSDPNELC